MSKPIKEGCRVVIVNTISGKNDGVEVTVGKRLGAILFKLSGRCEAWKIDKALGTVQGPMSSVIPEYMLRRIDDNDEELSTWEAVESICGFNLAKQKVK